MKITGVRTRLYEYQMEMRKQRLLDVALELAPVLWNAPRLRMYESSSAS